MNIVNLTNENIPLRVNYIKFTAQLCGDESSFDSKITTNFFENIYVFSDLLTFYTFQFNHL